MYFNFIEKYANVHNHTKMDTFFSLRQIRSVMEDLWGMSENSDKPSPLYDSSFEGKIMVGCTLLWWE